MADIEGGKDQSGGGVEKGVKKNHDTTKLKEPDSPVSGGGGLELHGTGGGAACLRPDIPAGGL